MTKLLASYGFYPLRGPEDEGGSGASSGGSTALTSDDPGAAAGAGDGGASEALYGKDGGEQKADDGGKAADDGGTDWQEYVEDPAKSAEENAAAKAEHDKTKPGEEGEKKDEKKEGEVIDPSSYDFEVPENFELDASIDKEFREFAAARKMSNDDVKALTGLQLKLYAKQAEQQAAIVEKWGEDLKVDKEIGGRELDANLAKARSARSVFFDDEAKLLLDKTGLGNHPAFVRGFVRMGKAMGEAGTLPGRGSGGNTTILENLYGSND